MKISTFLKQLFIRVLFTSVLISITTYSRAQGNAWTTISPMPTGRGFTSGTVVDGKIYVIGGFPTHTSVTGANEMYNPVTDTWTQKAEMPEGRCAHATCTYNGKIYVFGGVNQNPYATAQNNVYVYDPQTDVWTQKANMPYKNAFCGVAAINDTIYLIGGMQSYNAPPVSTVMAYHPLTDTWVVKTSMPTARGMLSACAFNGEIYAIGGTMNFLTNCFKAVEVYDPVTDTWTIRTSMPTARVALSVCTLNGKIYAIGGYNYPEMYTLNEMYDPVLDRWITKSPMQETRQTYFLGTVGDKIYAIGGSYPNPQNPANPVILNSAEEYTPCPVSFIDSGIVSGSWTKIGSPYYINGEITIPDSETLIIEPGVEVIFTGHYKLNVQGRLLAIGSATDTISFTAQDTVTGWHGIRFINTPSTNDSSKFIFCKLQYGKANSGVGLDRSGGALLISRFDKAFISNCLFDSNTNDGDPYSTGGSAIYMEYSSPKITRSTFINNNGITGALGCYFDSEALISNCIFSNNKACWGGGIACGLSVNNRPTITGNFISNNSAEDGGGLYFVWNSRALVINNIIVHNHATGEGGGINCEDTGGQQLLFANNTVAYNTSPIGGGIECDDNSDPIFLNTIFFGNSASIGNQIYISMDGSDPCFLNCDIEGGLNNIKGAGAGVNYTGVYLNNIDNDPLFVDESNNDFDLMNNSPCNGRGADSVEVNGTWHYAPKCDYKDNQRPNPSGTAPDIGAYESNLSTGLNKKLKLDENLQLYQNYPNPFYTSTTIPFSLQKPLWINLKMYDLSGQLVAILVDEKKQPGKYEVILKAENLRNGIYFYQLISNDELAITRTMMIN